MDAECGPLTGLPRFLEEEGVEMEISLPDLLLLAYPDWPATSQKLCGRPFPAERPTPGASKSLPQPPPTPPDPWPLTSVDETRAAVVTLVEKSRRGSALALRGWGVGSVRRPPLGVSISLLLLSPSTVMPGHLRIENYFCCVDFEVLSGEGLSPARSVSGCRGALGLMWWTTTGPPWVLTLALVRIRTQLQRARLCPISESRRQTKQSRHVHFF